MPYTRTRARSLSSSIAPGPSSTQKQEDSETDIVTQETHTTSHHSHIQHVAEESGVRNGHKRLRQETPLSSQSVKDLHVNVSALSNAYLGECLPIVNGGQSKGGVVAACVRCSTHTGMKASRSAATHLYPLDYYVQQDRERLMQHSLPPSHRLVVPGVIPLPRFPRLSGLMEWANAVCLFINIPAHSNSPGSTCTPYPNEWTREDNDGFTLLTWFASPQQRLHTPIIRRLVHSATDNKSCCSVLLFARVVGCPYRFYGTLSYVSHDAEQQPIKFIWKCNAMQRRRP